MEEFAEGYKIFGFNRVEGDGDWAVLGGALWLATDLPFVETGTSEQKGTARLGVASDIFWATQKRALILMRDGSEWFPLQWCPAAQIVGAPDVQEVYMRAMVTTQSIPVLAVLAVAMVINLLGALAEH